MSAVTRHSDTFLLPISGYICHGGWKEEALASQNTFSKVHDLKEQARNLPQYHSGGVRRSTSQDLHYVIISAVETPRQRICVRLVMDHDNSNVSLWANSRQCPPHQHQPLRQLSDNRGFNENNGQLWSFNLTRTSKWFAKNKNSKGGKGAH